MERDESGKQASGPSTSGSGNTSGMSDVCRVGVRVPPFWPEEPEVWFAQIEGQFILSNINSDSTKFYYVIGQLEPQYASEVKDIIVSPPAHNKYEKLKAELIKRLTSSKERKIKQLLMHEELGDRKPSQFLRHLQSLAGKSVSTDLMRTIWASRLPSNLQTIVALQKDNPLETVADLVDHVQDIAPLTVAQVASTPTDLSGTSLNSITKRLEELTRQVESLTLLQQRKSRPRHGNYNNRHSNRSRSNSKARYPADGHPHCFYHFRFGHKARKCVAPCSFKVGNGKGSR